MEINSSLFSINFNSPKCQTFLFCHSSNWKVIDNPKFLWSYACFCVWSIHSRSVWGRFRRFFSILRLLLTLLILLILLLEFHKNLVITFQVNVSTFLFLYCDHFRAFLKHQEPILKENSSPKLQYVNQMRTERLWLKGMGRGAQDSTSLVAFSLLPRQAQNNTEGFKEQTKNIALYNDQTWFRDKQAFFKNLPVFFQESAKAQMDVIRGQNCYCRDGKKGGRLGRSRSMITW